MFLEELSVINFRNLVNQNLKFEKGVTVFWGDNAQGKTNLLEAIYLLSTTKSFRSSTDHELIAWGEEEARVTGKADLLDLELIVRISGKDLKINKQPKRLTEIIGQFVTVLFTPSDVALVSGAPSERRRFLDHLGSLLSREYLAQLSNFNRVVKARNQLLFRLSQSHASIEKAKEDLWVWDEQLAKSASYIWVFREKLVLMLNEKLKHLGKKLLQQSLMLEYQTPYKVGEREKVAETFLKNLEAVRGEELARKQTTLGPQRDNFNVILEVESDTKVISKDLGIYGSRGEQRAAALALKLAEVELITEETKINPVLLLDEVLSELDETHRGLLLRAVYGGQTFITSTAFSTVESFLGKSTHQFKVSEGKVEKITV